MPPLLKELKQIDFFMHDSEHTYECMSFEFDSAFKVLNEGGVIVTDNITSNNSFNDFCKKNNLKLIKFHNIMGLAAN